MYVYTIQRMMMSKVSPHCDVQKVKKVAFAPGSCPLRVGKGVLDLGGSLSFPFVSFGRDGGTQQSIDHPPSCLCPCCLCTVWWT